MVLELRTDNQTIINDVNFEYSTFLDDINKCVISIAGNTTFQRNLLAVGNYISIYRDGVLDFRGKINSSGNIEGNSIKLIIRGEEEEYVKDKCDTTVLGTNGIWKNTASATIGAAILNTGVKYSAGTIDAGVNIDFKVANSDSKQNAISNLINKTGQEKYVDYVNQEIDILDNVGSSDVDILNEGSDFDNMYFQESEPSAKKIIVYGKGDGNNQITATATSVGYTAGEDATITINDPTIISTSEAQQRADIELAKVEQNIKAYNVPLNNPFKTYNIGDTLTINAPSYGVDGDSVRIVKIVRGRQGKNQFLRIEVTNTEYSQTLKSANQRATQLAVENRNKQTYMQGSGNTLNFTGMINGNSSAPLVVPVSLPADFIEDEAGNIRVTSFTLDYDIDKYRTSVGQATASGTDADVSGSSGESNPDVDGTSDLSDVDVDYEWNQRNRTSGDDNLSITNPLVLGDVDWTIISFYLLVEKTTVNNGFGIKIRNLDLSVDYYDETGFCLSGINSSGTGYAMFSSSIVVKGDIEGDDIRMYITDTDSDGESYGYGFSTSLVAEHDHVSGGYNAELHPHTSGSFEVSDDDVAGAITIGDDVSDAASVDSTGITWQLQYWNGTSWITKNSDTEAFPAGQTWHKDIDISDGGTYPDATGDWQVKIYTNNASSDLIKANVSVKHNLDNK